MAGATLIGRWGEELAAEYLRSKRYEILGLNSRCRSGELDIIACRGKYLVFCEVKLRKSPNFAQAREFVTRSKQRRLVIAAQLWMQQNPTNLQPRFDVIEIYAPQGMQTEDPIINHIENAFSEGYTI